MIKKIDDYSRDRSADFLDNAAQAEVVATATAIAATQAKNLPEKVILDDGTRVTQGQDENGKWRIRDCFDCEDTIPLARLRLGKVRCVACQTLKERREKGY